MGVPRFRVSPFSWPRTALSGLDTALYRENGWGGGMFRTVPLFHVSLHRFMHRNSAPNLFENPSESILDSKGSKDPKDSKDLNDLNDPKDPKDLRFLFLSATFYPFLSKVNLSSTKSTFPVMRATFSGKQSTFSGKRHCYSSFLIPQLVFSAVCL